MMWRKLRSISSSRLGRYVFFWVLVVGSYRLSWSTSAVMCGGSSTEVNVEMKAGNLSCWNLNVGGAGFK